MKKITLALVAALAMVAVLATAAAALIHRVEDQAGRLLPVADEDSASGQPVSATPAG